ncbi:MAG: hypothetical protein A3H72_00100 [Candidatus Doudnabacteria bacterium RIFCSPLOWO2_02_FULL_48_8]|nr:MAG: hypothetical protein A3H72_00100 [Candidatus Doudnabacteria bacterium RIFCSPLOWO2_02_FULL_48_8]
MHVLGTPPAFILSQDQTLQMNWRYVFLKRFIATFIESKLLTSSSSFFKTGAGLIPNKLSAKQIFIDSVVKVLH